MGMSHCAPGQSHHAAQCCPSHLGLRSPLSHPSSPGTEVFPPTPNLPLFRLDSGSLLLEVLKRNLSSPVHMPCLPPYLLRQKGYNLGADGTQSLDNLCLKEEAGITTERL